MKIDQIRDMQKRLRFRPMEGGRRACILDSADRLNDAASNALLKTLEEPPEETHLFLITSRPHQLLPTILSRCQWVKFKPLSSAHIVQILRTAHSLEEDRPNSMPPWPGEAWVRLWRSATGWIFRSALAWLRAFSEIPEKTTEEIFETCERMAKEEEENQDLLELWKIWVRDLMVFKIQGKAGRGELINHDLGAEVARQAKKVFL